MGESPPPNMEKYKIQKKIPQKVSPSGAKTRELSGTPPFIDRGQRETGVEWNAPPIKGVAWDPQHYKQNTRGLSGTPQSLHITYQSHLLN